MNVRGRSAWTGAPRNVSMKPLLYIIALITVLVPSAAAGLEYRAADSPEHASIDRIEIDEISPATVRSTVEAVFADRFPEVAPRLDVRVVRMGSSVERASALRVRFNQSDAIPRGHAQIRLLTLNDGSWDEAGWALLYVAHFDSVAIARSDVPAGRDVRPANVTFAWMETTKFRGEPLLPRDLRILGGEAVFARRPLRAGEAVRKDDLRPAYAAETGQTITVTYRRGGLSMKLRCQAREPGHLGDVIRAYNSDTKSTYQVILTGSGAAKWKSTL